MRLRVLGTIAVDGEPVRSPKVRRLLAVLAARHGDVVPADRLVDEVWPDDAPAHADAALHSLVARARAVLGDGALLTRPPGYALDLPTDATRFVALAEQAGGTPEPAALLDEALALWRGPAFAEFADDDPLRPEAARLEEMRALAEEARVQADLALDRPEAAVARLDPLVAAAPFRERRRELLVDALARAGRAADALAAVASYRRLLADELGLDPGAELRRLEAAVLAGDVRGARGVAARASLGALDAAKDALASPPRARAGLVGRETALAEITAGLRAGPGPLTLVGPGGVGKTALARHVADSFAPSCPDGVVVAELATLSDGDEVAAAVVAAVGAPGGSAPERDLADRVVDVLRGRRLLLVLDNCEHVVDTAAALLETVTAACPTVTVLATSREPLGVTGERVRPVPPLAEPDAVALFVARGGAASPDFALTDDNRAAVVDVCRRLDRLPLALELAAARMRVLSAAELAADLPAHLRALRSPRRSGEPRHRTLHAVVDWSYRLLDPDERALLDRLSVFAGGFTLAAARAVAGPETDLVLADLVDKSLVTATVDHTRPGPSRYALLETVRAYARERLAERGETAVLRRRHAEQALVFLRGVGSLAGPESAARLATIEAGWDELRAAVGWATEHDPALAAALVARLVDHAEARMTPEVFGWADRLLDGGADLGTAAPTVHAVAAAGARFAGDLARAGRHLDAGVALLDGPDDLRGRHLAYLRAECALFAGQVDDSAVAAVEALRLADAAGDERVRGLAGATDALAAAYAGDLGVGIARADALDARRRAHGDPLLAPWTLYIAGEVRADSDPPRALALIEEALDAARATGERYALGVALVTATSLRARLGDHPGAARSATETLEHWRGTGNRTHQWVGLRQVVELLTARGDDHAAAELLGGLAARRSGGTLFGADAARFAELRTLLAVRIGDAAARAAEDRGAARDDDGLVDLARGALRRTDD